MNRIFSVLTFLWIILVVAIPKVQAEAVKPNGETVILASSKKTNVRVEIKTHEVQIGKPSDGVPGKRCNSCTYSRYPCSIVDCMDISVNGKPIFVPRSAFSDLADLNEVTIKIEKKKIIIKIIGGDASESYIVKIDLNSERIIHRSLVSGEFPDEILEETIYPKQHPIDN